MKDIHQLEQELDSLYSKITILKHEIKMIQHQCQHQFQDARTYRTCVKCHFVEVLRY